MTNLIDVLQRDFSDTYKVIVERMEDVAGEEVLVSLYSLYPDQGEAMNWFYNQKLDDGKTVYDYCVNGRQEEVLKSLIRVKHNVLW